MPFEDAARHLMLDALDELAAGGITHVSVLDDTLTELTGGSPAYARDAATWDAAASGQKDNGAQLDWDVPAGATIAAYGLASSLATGNGRDLGWLPNGGVAAFAAIVKTSATTDLIESDAHGLVNNDRVFLYDVLGAGLPTGLSELTLYHVINANTDDFQVSATQGGAAVAITGDGELMVQKVTVETFGAQGTHSVAAGSLVLDARVV